MSVNRSTKEVEEHQDVALEEGYWEALLNEGEYAKSTNIEPDFSPDTGTRDITPNTIATTPTKTEVDENDWEIVAEIQNNAEILELEVIAYNRGGLLVEWKSLRGFIPASQLLYTTNSDNYSQQENTLKNYVGKILNLRVIELNVEKNRLIFSERAAQVEAGKRSQILHNLASDTIVEGRVTNLCDFGAFIDLGGIEGLIHISELSWGRVAHPTDMLTSGEKIKVYILHVNEEEERIALSLKRLYDDPWETVQERYRVGEIVEGRITNVVDFGAFACIEEGLEGLVHFSELAEGQFLHPRNVVSENDIVKARILSINSKTRRLGLSLRHV
jgi:small subunit ribosomal protein S1